MIEILIAILLGVFFGIISGITPGVHINLVSVLLLAVSTYLLNFISPLFLAALIVAMAITHTFLDIIPSVYLGVPDEDKAMNALPGHRKLLQGKAFEAVQLSIIGALLGLIVSIICLPLFLSVTSYVYEIIKNYMGWILLVLCLFLILREKNKLWCLILFLISGCLGIVVLNLNSNEVLFPLFSGMFGIAMLISSLKQKINIPEQKITNAECNQKFKAVSCSVVVGWIASFMPGLGPAQAAAICSAIIKLEEEGFMVLVGGLSTVNMALSLITFYLMDKARNGAIVVVSKIIDISFQDFLILSFVALIAGCISAIISLKLSKVFSKVITKINYRKLCFIIIIFIIILVLFICSWIGLIILISSTFIGLIPENKEIPRSHMMGCLLIPVMIYFLL